MTTYLVTGGAGFIGSNLVDSLLEDGKRVIVIDNFNKVYDPKIKEKNIENCISNKNFSLERIDICNREELKRVFDNNKIDIVVHLAGIGGVRESLNNPLFYQNVNEIGLQNLLEEMRLHNIKDIIFSSSSSVYGDTSHMPYKEDDICDKPISVYAQTKRASEMLLYVYHKIYNFKVISMRFFTVYGKRQRPDLAISKFTKAIINDEEIDVYGNGENFRDYTYISDIIDGIMKSIEYIKNNDNVYEIINLASHNPIKLNDMILAIETALNKKAKINVQPMQPGDVLNTYASIEKAEQLIGYSPKVSFEDGIKNFVEWYKENNI